MIKLKIKKRTLEFILTIIILKYNKLVFNNLDKVLWFLIKKTAGKSY